MTIRSTHKYYIDQLAIQSSSNYKDYWYFLYLERTSNARRRFADNPLAGMDVIRSTGAKSGVD